MVKGAVSAESSGCSGHCSQEHLQLERLEAVPGVACHMCGCTQVGMPLVTSEKTGPTFQVTGGRVTQHSSFMRPLPS